MLAAVNSTVAQQWGSSTPGKSVFQVLAERVCTFWYVALPFDVETAAAKDVIGDAIPIFILLIAAEFLYGVFVLRRNLYRFNDLMGSLCSGITQQWVGSLVKFLTVPLYVRLYTDFRLTDGLGLGSIVMLWTATALGVEFAYYWFHRFSHEYQLLWQTHRVHHCGETYNLATALRQGAYQPLTSFFVSTVPMALLGVPPRMYTIHASMNTVSQFWFHTEAIHRLPFGLEWVLNTPAHHRRHHLYPGNCNYGGFLIIFDRMFGTFEQEPECDTYDPNYGTAEQMDTFNGVEMNLRGLRKLWHLARHSKAGLFARRWDSHSGSGNYRGVEPPPLRRPVYEGYAATLKPAPDGSRVEGVCRNVAAFLLTLASLGLQLAAKDKSGGEAVLSALVGCGLIYLSGMCLDGPQPRKVD